MNAHDLPLEQKNRGAARLGFERLLDDICSSAGNEPSRNRTAWTGYSGSVHSHAVDSHKKDGALGCRGRMSLVCAQPSFQEGRHPHVHGLWRIRA